jgi:tRNA(Ile)-lysidine synthase
MELLKDVQGTIERYQLLSRGDALVVGVSGGPDSLCLLHVLLRLRDVYALRLHVAHLNHRLRGAEAEADAAFVAQLAATWGLPATIESRDVAALARDKSLAIEEAARQARYAFLARVARHWGAAKIAVGHNADDQVETIVMHWLRGSGLAGLRGMLPASKLEEMRLAVEETNTSAADARLLLIRPLLETPRADIEAYCAEEGLEPRFDRSNLDTTYYRNRLRHELLPLLETFNPQVRQVILRTAEIIRADYALLRREVARTWSRITVSENEEAIVFDLEKWRALPLSLQRSILRQAIHRLRRSLRNINWVHVENAIAVLSTGHTGAKATLPRGLEVRIRYDQFIVGNRGYVPPLPDQPWLRDVQVPLSLPGQTALPGSEWRIVAEILQGEELDQGALEHTQPWQAYLDLEVTGSDLSLRTRRPGDRFWPQGLGDKPTSVNSFMINAKIPQAWRDRIPLLVSPKQVLWMAGWRIDERAKVTAETKRILQLSFVKSKRART